MREEAPRSPAACVPTLPADMVAVLASIWSGLSVDGWPQILLNSPKIWDRLEHRPADVARAIVNRAIDISLTIGG
jgi:hypothetical protein